MYCSCATAVQVCLSRLHLFCCSVPLQGCNFTTSCQRGSITVSFYHQAFRKIPEIPTQSFHGAQFELYKLTKAIFAWIRRFLILLLFKVWLFLINKCFSLTTWIHFDHTNMSSTEFISMYSEFPYSAVCVFIQHTCTIWQIQHCQCIWLQWFTPTLHTLKISYKHTKK